MKRITSCTYPPQSENGRVQSNDGAEDFEFSAPSSSAVNASRVRKSIHLSSGTNISPQDWSDASVESRRIKP